MIYSFIAPYTSHPARLKKIKLELSKILQTQVQKIALHHCYLIQFKNQPTQPICDEIASLVSAISYQEITQLSFLDCVMNIPRFGTQSSFSSKAKDILTISGFEIGAIEQSDLWTFSDKKFNNLKQETEIKTKVEKLISDPMTHQVLWKNDVTLHFQTQNAKSFQEIDILKLGAAELKKFNLEKGLALSNQDINYLVSAYTKMNKNPSDVELMMFSAVNSEHCRHKIFNAKFILNGKEQKRSLFEMIKNTSEKSPDELITAYSDNSSIIKGHQVKYFYRSKDGSYQTSDENQAILMKVETHNHPTVISPYAGAATGSGGEIRDEGATGRGGKPIAGLCGFSVSNLHLPNYPQVWERKKIYQKNYPEHMATSLEIMIEAPIGSANYNNEFGRANLAGYFRSFEYVDEQNKRWGYHKPIMIAGGTGQIISQNFKKKKVKKGALVIVLGPPALKIGIGGGSASSASLDSKKDNQLDFASVQRENPEAQRRCQEVINHCIDLKEENPIISIHDVGAGGLSNAISELIYDNDLGASLDFNKIAINDQSMNPLEIWCNESQERYVLAIEPISLEWFEKICKKERCPFQVLGTTDESKKLTLNDHKFNNKPVDIHLDWFFSKPERLEIEDDVLNKSKDERVKKIDYSELSIEKSIESVLSHPSVGSKAFLIHIGDRSVGGKTVQDQMIGRFQVPIADCAVCFDDFIHFTGSAMAMGERPALALLDSAASTRVAVTEAILNLAGADIDYSKIALSANWMADCSDKENKDPNNQENAKLFQAVKAIGMKFCPDLSIAIPVGKDSLSMKMIWSKNKQNYQVTSPVSVNISAFAKVKDVRKTITPELKKTHQDTKLICVRISEQNHLSSSIFLQTHDSIGSKAIDVRADDLKNFLKIFHHFKKKEKVLACHDISDGGLLAAVFEMQMTTRQSIFINLQAKTNQKLFEILFSESPAMVIQVKSNDAKEMIEAFKQQKLEAQEIALVKSNQVCDREILKIFQNNKLIYQSHRATLEKIFSRVSMEIRKLRDDPKLAEDEFNAISHKQTKLFLDLSFNPKGLGQIETFTKYLKTKPKVAILREQGVNGYLEMAYAFAKAGFKCQDVHMSELINGEAQLQSFQGIGFPGGFSYGDTFGAATGWASSILHHPSLLEQFEKFFNQKDTFGLGLCNGCQVLSKLKGIIPGAELWPSFKHNLSSQFEARKVMVKVEKSSSIFFNEMAGSFIPVVVSHMQGRAEFENDAYQKADENNLIAMRYVNFDKTIATGYPMNPNGSSHGVCSLTNQDGRFTIMMPHPERTLRSIQFNGLMNEIGEYSPWLKLFENARKFLD